MEPRIQYAKTADGVNIAFWTMGEGPPLVIPANISAGHLQMELEMPPFRTVYARLAERLQIIHYDCRGVGMSQRDALDFSVDAAERDLNAVVDRLGLERFALYGHVTAGAVPLAYAARHAARVSCLVYWIGQTVRLSPEIMRRLTLIDPLMDEDWDLYVNLRARVMFGWDSIGAKAYASSLGAAQSPASLRPATEAIMHSVNQDFAREVRAPTLVLHLQSQWTTDVARNLASEIPTAHVAAVPGPPTTRMPFLYDNEVLLSAIADFVEATSAGGGETIAPPELKLAAMRAIVWTDLEEHTEMMERLGDARGREALREHERITREALAAHGGAEVKAMGDGFMAWFPSAQQALDCAIALQRAFAAYNEGAPEPLRVRVGVNAGEPIAEEDDLFGASVIAAARVCRHAAGGEIVASDVVRQLVAGKGFAFSDRGQVALKGFEDPTRLYEVRWREDES